MTLLMTHSSLSKVNVKGLGRLRVAIGSVFVAISLLLLRFFQLSEANLFWIALMGFGVVLFIVGLKWLLDSVTFLQAYRDMWPIFSLGMVIAWLIHAARVEDLVAASWLGQLFGTLTVSVSTMLLRVCGANVMPEGNTLFFGSPSLISAVQVTPLCGGFLSVLMFIAAFAFILIDVGRTLGSWRLILLFLLGMTVTLIAALLRVFVVTLAGFYWGFETMMLAHTYVGYVLFLIVVCGFWYVSIEWSKRLTQSR
jgi:exosortase/archaeosortase family protein